MDFVDSTIDVVILMFAATACIVVLAFVLSACIAYIKKASRPPDSQVFRSEDDPPHYEGH